MTEPPPARVEYVPPRPETKGAVWLDGEWGLRRGRWAWTLGRWVVTPTGASYAPWAFVRGPDGTLYYAPGAFFDAERKPLPPPPPLVEAKASTVAVVDPDGVTETTGRTRRAAVAMPKKGPSHDEAGAPAGDAGPLGRGG